MSKVPIKVLLDETMAPFMPFITTSAVQLQDGEHSLEDLETAVANSIITGSYNNLNKKIILTAQNGHTVEFSIADIIYGLQSEITNQNKLSSDLVDDSNHTNKFVSASDKTTWNGKQDALVSGTNIKTINNQSILGSGNISISGGGDTSDYTDLENKPSINNVTLSGNKSSSDLSLQDALVSGTNIKTINNESILGSGNMSISGGQTIQYAIMPIASASNVGDIIQFTGTTGSTYTNGYFYKCVENNGTYSWKEIEVQNTKYYINGNYLFYNFIVGNYSLQPNSTIEWTSTNVSKEEMAEAIKTAYLHGKKLVANIFTIQTSTLNSYYFQETLTTNSSQYINGFHYTVDSGGQGNVWWAKLRVRYTYDNGTFAVTRIASSGDQQLVLGMKNTNIYTPTADSYNPSTAKYSEQMVQSVAPAYSTSSTYAVGDFVSYQGKLYKCSTAIGTAESWNSSHWTETTAMSVVGNISTVLSSLVTVGGNQ